MLNRVELLFPTALPQERKRIYYQALQVVTMLHEESAKIEILDQKEFKDSYPQIKSYHQAVRNFRNWSAHNQFSSNEIDAKLFAYMFCITLRSYFQPLETQFMVKNQDEEVADCYDVYEEEYYQLVKSTKIDAGNFKDKYKKVFNKHFEKVENLSDKRKCWECRNIDELLLASGKCKTSKPDERMNISDLLLNILDNCIVQKPEDCIIQKPEEDDCAKKYTIQYIWDDDAPSNLGSEQLKDGDLFKYCAYKLFCIL